MNDINAKSNTYPFVEVVIYSEIVRSICPVNQSRFSRQNLCCIVHSILSAGIGSFNFYPTLFIRKFGTPHPRKTDNFVLYIFVTTTTTTTTTTTETTTNTTAATTTTTTPTTQRQCQTVSTNYIQRCTRCEGTLTKPIRSQTNCVECIGK